MRPNLWPAWASLGETRRLQGDLEGAVTAFRTAVDGDPQAWNAVQRLAWIYATNERLRDGRRALLLADSLNEATGFQNPLYLETLAAAHAALGNFADALRRQDQALTRIPPASSAKALERRDRYLGNQPWTE